MKKKFQYLILICTFLNLFSGCTSISNDVNLRTSKMMNYEEVKDSLIRFHVIANSDTDEDQNLKLKIRDEVIDYLYPYLNNSNSLEESRKIIKNNMDEVQRIAENVIKKNNYIHTVKLELSRENFPEKSYGNVTLPQGNYEAFRIIIGDGKGKNWWCVMFPPLCFVDESKAQIQYENTENKINQEIKKENPNKKIKIKFKIIEVIKDLFL